MKKILAAVLFIVTLFLIGYSFTTKNTVPIRQEEVSKVVASKDVTETAKVFTAKPKRLIIKSLDIDTQIEHVGMDEKGNMDVPRQDENVAWFEPGFIPGALGSSVLAGHYDTRTGAPAIFYKLDSLQKGDTIIVEDSNGERLSFHVTHKETYPADDFPLMTVFGPADIPRLNLITCEGQYNNEKKTYTHRTVVFTELSDPY